jgi:hypothetical protein
LILRELDSEEEGEFAQFLCECNDVTCLGN